MEKLNNQVTARASSNIALVKYWGKRDPLLNLPAVGSISVTLEKLFTTTSVHFDPALKHDEIFINHKTAPAPAASRVSAFLDLIRQQRGITTRACVRSDNNFPTGAGLASSASAFAALALAGTHACGLKSSTRQLSELARRGSGSAARSIYGGFVEMHRGKRADGRDAVAVQLAEPDFWDLRLVILVTTPAEKKMSSGAGMIGSEKSSPYYKEWVRGSINDLKEMRQALLNRDFQKVGELAEYNCLKMHAVAMTNRPSLIYWNERTIAIMHRICELRHSGIPVYFTIDAGPQVKVLTLPEYAGKIQKAFQDSPLVHSILESGLGPDARIMEDGI